LIFGLDCAYKWLTGNERFYSNQVMPTLHRWVDCEHSHRLAITAARMGLLPRFGANHIEYPELNTRLFDWQLKNPIGLAAGFDKDAEAVTQLASAGFGFVEIGTVTPLPQAGNVKPRIFRLREDKAVINRYGFNSAGAEVVEARLRQAKEADNEHHVVGMNIGRNKISRDAIEDFRIGLRTFTRLADYLVINISSPNTPRLRKMQRKDELKKLMTALKEERDRMDNGRVKILLKIAPDLSMKEMFDIAQVCRDPSYSIDGLIISNTTIARPNDLLSEEHFRIGGLSGQPLKQMSTHAIRVMYRFTEGQIPIIGCGGVASGQDAYEKIKAGASAIQLYTAIVFDGFPVIGKVKRELSTLVKQDGYGNVSEAIGVDNRW